MAGSEQSRVEDIRRNMTEGDREAEELVFDPVTQTIRSTRRGHPTGNELRFSREDLGYAGTGGASGSIVITANQLEESAKACGNAAWRFRCLDDGDVFSAVNVTESETAVRGAICFSSGVETADAEAFTTPGDRVRLLARRRSAPAQLPVSPQDTAAWSVRGFIRRDDQWVEAPVKILPLKEVLFCRTRGILETAALADKRVFMAGAGSINSRVSIGLTESGVMHQFMMEPDRLGPENIMRHAAGLSQVGRFKTRAMADLIRDKNPYAHTETYEERITWETQDLVRRLVRKSDLVICGADEPIAREVVNLVCVQERKTLILPGAMRRAHGGQVLIVRPYRSPCYQCFLMCGPGKSPDREVSSDEAAARLAYSDRPVVAEPGLSNDIAPICQMVVKLAIQHLLADAATTLRSLDEDLTAPWYLWLNRREAETQYENLKPLAYNVDGMHVMRWYGIALKPHPSCPVCGDFIGTLSAEEELLLEA